MLTRVFNLVCPPGVHPNVLARRKVRRVAGGAVLAGPFAGLKYAPRSVGSAYEPKLLGTYEMELRGVVERLCAADFGRIVNVGAGEGYYAVGLAVRCPAAEVVAFEGDPAGRELIRRMAQLNGVSGRVRVEGVCGPAELERELSGEARKLVVMDVEGGERALLRPEEVPALGAAHVLVELHDFIHPGLGAEIEARFRGTHRIEKIKQRPRRAADLPFRSLLLDRWVVRLTDEQRPVLMEWLYLRPLDGASS